MVSLSCPIVVRIDVEAGASVTVSDARLEDGSESATPAGGATVAVHRVELTLGKTPKIPTVANLPGAMLGIVPLILPPETVTSLAPPPMYSSFVGAGSMAKAKVALFTVLDPRL